MKRKLQIAAALLGLWPIIILAAQGDREFQLSGNGSSNNNFNTNNFGASTSLSYYRTGSQEIGVRQGISIASFEDAPDAWNGTTRGFYDFNFELDTLRLFIGMNAGYIYGSQVDDAFIAGPEAGLDIPVKSETFISLGIEYPFLFQQIDRVDEAIDNGLLVYTLGIGFSF
jgi:hypothetical protein